MVFKIFGRDEPRESDEADFIEIDTAGEEKRRVNIRIENLNDYRDIEELQRLIREGNIVFLRIKKLKDRDLGELKRSIERLRRTSIAMNGDIIGVDEDFLILTPSFAKIYRGEGEGIQTIKK